MGIIATGALPGCRGTARADAAAAEGFGEINGGEYGTENGGEVHVQARTTKAHSTSASADVEGEGRT